MSLADQIRTRVFSIGFQDLTTWSVAAQFAAEWNWPLEIIKPLGRILKRRSEAALETLSPEAMVTLLTIRFDGSIEAREPIQIKDIKGKLFRVHPGDVVFSKIDVRNGSIGLAPDDIECMCVTSEFPAYSVKSDRALPEYVKLLFRTKAFTISDDLNLLKVENCRGGDDSFGGDNIIVSGIFISCQGGQQSFGGNYSTASGTFISCETSGSTSDGSGRYSFGGEYGTASGTFINCKSEGVNSFGGDAGTASGIFMNCEGEDQNFGGVNSTASGTFTNCKGSANAFGGFNGTASGIFTNCRGNQQSFGGGFAPGSGTCSGELNNCIAGVNSFGGNGILSGKLYYCRITSFGSGVGTFRTVSSPGVTRLCIDANNNENNQG